MGAVLPPLVGVIAFLFLYGESGFVSLLLQRVLRLEEPPWVLQGPGENAGAIDSAEGLDRQSPHLVAEVRRQIGQWEESGSLGKKSTYGWDEATQSTFHQRDKEEAHDYRYFPDPDLLPVEVDVAPDGERLVFRALTGTQA